MVATNPLHADATWETIVNAVASRRTVTAVYKGVKAFNVWLLTNVAHELPGIDKTDAFNLEVIEGATMTRDRYLDVYDRRSAFLPSAPVYVMARDSRIFAYVTHDGQFIVREDLTTRERAALNRIQVRKNDMLATLFAA